MNRNPKYYLNPQGEFIIENYQFAKPLANLFPGIAGKYGIPMWVFYVNRGQGIASFGTKDKDHAICEFFPANRAWQLTPTQGFRTFLKVSCGKEQVFYEPFNNCLAGSPFKITNKMSIASCELAIEETNLSLGIKTKVEYFTVPNESYAALARIVTLKNLDKKPKKIELLDGLPVIVAFGIANLFLKKLGRTIEAWMKVKNLKHSAAFYKIDVDPTDRPQVIHIAGGNFFLGFYYDKNKPKILKPIVDPQCIFGPVTDLSCPYKFLSEKTFNYPLRQITTNKTPCGFILKGFRLAAGEEISFYSLIGNMRNIESLNSSIPRIVKPGYLKQKRDENRKLIAGLQKDVETQSSLKALDLYVKQTYLDNIMRGGYPEIFKCDGRKAVFYLYSRKHGDLERDYNKFLIQPTYFSQGNGNYRDMNQNRRCDNWFNPEIEDENVITLFNLIQTDGFNPLVVKGNTFVLKDSWELEEKLKGALNADELSRLLPVLKQPFSPGEAILFLKEHKIKLKISYDRFLDILLSYCIKIQDAEHGEGFWTDHWTYNLDLLENYLALFPEKFKEIIFEKRAFTFYDNSETVKPRSQKYILKDNRVWQFHCLIPDSAKKELFKKRLTQPDIVRGDYGKGEIYKTTLINKLLCLLANKFASLDPFGVGIEMEADKPNWFDSLNGLPGLLGSSINETFETKRLAIFIKESIAKCALEKVSLSEEFHNLLIGLNNAAKDYFGSNAGSRDFEFWDKTHSLKEDYRHNTKYGLSGKENEISRESLFAILDNILRKIDLGIEKAKDKNKGIYYAYFINEAVEYEKLDGHFARPLAFKQKRLPLFLEGQFHALRMAGDIRQAKKIYASTRKSALYDRKLKMYKVTAPLKEMPEEIGRCRVFTPGWLENESIWLHMEYKYLLEVLKKGLDEEFYRDFKNILIPFQNPERYGRSILENSSFLVSSAFPDQNLHGNGFVARLSGSTAEFINIWLIMNIGKKPFILNEKGELNLRFSPHLAGWLFKKSGTYNFNFLKKITVTYHNRKRKNTFGADALRPVKFIFRDKDNNPVEISGDTIPAPYAGQIRSRLILSLDVYLG